MTVRQEEAAPLLLHEKRGRHIQSGGIIERHSSTPGKMVKSHHGAATVSGE
jgi:hypothetical protein